MKRLIVCVLLLLTLSAVTPQISTAQNFTGGAVCQKVKDTGPKYSGAVNIFRDWPYVDTTCEFKNAKAFWVCSGVDYDVESGWTPSTPEPFDGVPLEDDLVCYRAKCPKEVFEGHFYEDPMGVREIDNIVEKLVCLPAYLIAPTTTSTTSTTLP